MTSIYDNRFGGTTAVGTPNPGDWAGVYQRSGGMGPWSMGMAPFCSAYAPTDPLYQASFFGAPAPVYRG